MFLFPVHIVLAALLPLIDTVPPAAAETIQHRNHWTNFQIPTRRAATMKIRLLLIHILYQHLQHKT